MQKRTCFYDARDGSQGLVNARQELTAEPQSGLFNFYFETRFRLVLNSPSFYLTCLSSGIIPFRFSFVLVFWFWKPGQGWALLDEVLPLRSTSASLLSRLHPSSPVSCHLRDPRTSHSRFSIQIGSWEFSYHRFVSKHTGRHAASWDLTVGNLYVLGWPLVT